MRLLVLLTAGAFASVIAVALNPIAGGFQRVALLFGLAGTWAGLALLGWRKTPLRIALIVVPTIVAVLLALPGRAINASALRDDYVHRMADFEGTTYLWGGESSRGIDCSGLPRRAYRDALLWYGIRNFNSRALREYVGQWWYDSSARALGEGYRGNTVPLGVAGTIREIDHHALREGDLAVTTNGIHVLAYVGDGQWIQADPGIGAVATLDGHTADNSWFLAPITVHRWALLDSDARE